jgi:hypothetical protein
MGCYNARMNWTDIPWPVKLIGLWVLVNFLPARRVMAHARRLGRQPWAWLVVSLLFTAVPFIFVAARARPAPAGGKDSRAASGMKRCPHCRRLFDRREMSRGGPEARCPLCGMAIGREDVA